MIGRGHCQTDRHIGGSPFVTATLRVTTLHVDEKHRLYVTARAEVRRSRADFE